MHKCLMYVLSWVLRFGFGFTKVILLFISWIMFALLKCQV